LVSDFDATAHNLITTNNYLGKNLITVSSAELDHIILATASLEQGEKFISSKLGVQPSPGGYHPDQGTHNSLLKLDQDRYLEIIAINPEGKKPEHPRWFNLDDPVLQKQIRKQPQIITWVARTDDMKDSLSQATYNPGIPHAASRGSLRWTFTFPKDGALIQNGLLPHLIEWDTPVHPSSKLPESKIEISRITAFHPSPAMIYRHLKSLGLQNVLDLEKSNESEIGLKIILNCPLGEVALNSLQNTNQNKQ
jgi:hypothetical protein